MRQLPFNQMFNPFWIKTWPILCNFRNQIEYAIILSWPSFHHNSATSISSQDPQYYGKIMLSIISDIVSNSPKWLVEIPSQYPLGNDNIFHLRERGNHWLKSALGYFPEGFPNVQYIMFVGRRTFKNQLFSVHVVGVSSATYPDRIKFYQIIFDGRTYPPLTTPPPTEIRPC